MPEQLKILGQQAPAGGADTTLYSPGAGKSAAVSSVVVCNTSGAATTFRVHARIQNAAVAVGNALVYEQPIPAGETVALVLGVTLMTTDLLSVRAAAAGVTFTAFGSEIS